MNFSDAYGTAAIIIYSAVISVIWLRTLYRISQENRALKGSVKVLEGEASMLRSEVRRFNVESDNWQRLYRGAERSVGQLLHMVPPGEIDESRITAGSIRGTQIALADDTPAWMQGSWGRLIPVVENTQDGPSAQENAVKAPPNVLSYSTRRKLYPKRKNADPTPSV